MIREKLDQEALTPMMRQYFTMKEKYSNEILFFRMGDFYEMFFDDARTASEILGITLTSRSKDKEAVPMAGIPVRAIDSYLPRLLKAGKRVAICEQLEDPKDARGLVDRDVIRVISPGTITDEKIVGEKSNNFIIALVEGKDGLGLAWLDVTTGQFLIWQSPSAAAVSAQITRLDPAECVLPEALEFSIASRPEVEAGLEGVVMTPHPDVFFEEDSAYRALTEHFRTRTLEGFGCEGLRLAIRAGGGLMSYVTETQKASLKHITRVRPFLAERHVPIDRATRRALELTETFRGEHGATLLSTFDRTSTALGARKLRDWILSPLTDIAAIVLRQDAVAEIGADPDFAEKLTGLLGQAHDLERISTRISYRSANARDLVALKRTLDLLPQLRELLRATSSSFLRDCGDHMVEPRGLAAAIAAALVDEPPLSVKEGGLVRKGHDAALDELREIATQGTRWIARFQEEEAQKTAIPSLKIGFNKVFGYYIEVTNTHREKIPDRYIRKQTLKGCERFVTAELKDYETKVLHAKDRAIEIEHEIFARIREEAAGHIATIQAAADAIAEADVVATFGLVAKERGYTRPTVNDGLRLSIEDGRHPVIERIAGADRFIPNSVDLDPERNIMIITGPNMAGKSTYIRQVAILTLLAQTGSFIPARSAEIGIIDRIFTRVGASDDLARGHSTFMVEMNETANILNNVSRRGLIILDEVGRGTSTFDGVSLAWAITEHIAERIGARTLFATHYHELTALSLTFPTVRNFNFAVKEWNDDIIFLRKIVEGGSDKSYGIHVARLAGIPRGVLDRAREILSNLESQELDIHDQPALASRKHAPGARDPGGPNAVRMRQLDLFQDSNDAVLKELKKLEIDHMTPVEALQRLLDLKKRIV